MSEERGNAAEHHEFLRRPQRVFLRLTIPVLLSLIAEPLTGIADTAFVARLGSTQLAALGVAVTLLGSLFWVFNFLGIGTQTAVAQALGRSEEAAAREAATTAVVAAFALGLGVGLAAWPWLEELAAFMGARGEMAVDAATYLEIRFLGAPAVLATMVSFGALRGLQDMRTPFWIAVSLNVANIGLDAILIFGWGPIPAFGLEGAAWATVASQWFGATWAILAARAALGGAASVRLSNLAALFVVGRDLVARTGLLLFFLLLATRAATQIGPLEGAAQQAVRQVWMLAAFLLDAFAASAQSLVGFFVGAGRPAIARRVAGVACGWALGAGFVLTAAFALGEQSIAWLLVPPEAHGAFAAVWLAAILAQPLNALAFATDGIHWGTGDYRYLRNVMLLATAVGALGLLRIDLGAPSAFLGIWVVTAVWIGIRGSFGILRVWPGIGQAPLRTPEPECTAVQPD